MVIPDPDKFISPTIRRALEAQQKIASIAKTSVEKSSYLNLLNNIYSRQGTLSAATLRAYKTGLPHMFKAKTAFERLMDFSYPGYLQKLSENFPELLENEHENIELADYDFLPDELGSEKKIIIYKEVPKVQLMLERICRDHSKIHELHPRDGGCDLICLKSMDDMEFKLIGECKRNAVNRKIGVGILRGLQTVISDESAHKGAIFTTSYFTKDSVDYSNRYDPKKIELRNLDYIINWIRR